ncbi:MAG: hypothetical protein K2X38_00255 [Gemmataceae bacterium]|nr:hypothetical protein [Gemmataceae bacterium]
MNTATPALCRHCNRRPVGRPRGLCWVCYYEPGVRQLYPSESIFARRSFGNVYRAAPLPPSPTVAAPGSPEKVRILMERARAGVSLWHPRDAAFV